MSENYGFEEYIDEIPTEVRAESGGMKALREKAEADSKRIQELSEKLARLEESRRRDSVGDLFKAAGVNPGAAKFYNGEPDPEKIQAWVTENSEILSLRQGEGIPSHEEAQTTPTPPVVTFEQQQAFLRMQNAGIDGTPADNHTEVMGSLNSAENMEDLLAAMQRHGWTGSL